MTLLDLILAGLGVLAALFVGFCLLLMTLMAIGAIREHDDDDSAKDAAKNLGTSFRSGQ